MPFVKDSCPGDTTIGTSTQIGTPGRDVDVVAIIGVDDKEATFVSSAGVNPVGRAIALDDAMTLGSTAHNKG